MKELTYEEWQKNPTPRMMWVWSYDDECWVAEPSSAEIYPPVAWCEIQKYKE